MGVCSVDFSRYKLELRDNKYKYFLGVDVMSSSLFENVANVSEALYSRYTDVANKRAEVVSGLADYRSMLHKVLEDFVVECGFVDVDLKASGTGDVGRISVEDTNDLLVPCEIVFRVYCKDGTLKKNVSRKNTPSIKEYMSDDTDFLRTYLQKVKTYYTKTVFVPQSVIE